MPSVQKVLFFKKVAIILSIIWTVICTTFFIYQLQGEQKHILNHVVSNSKDIAQQSEYIINWAFQQKLKHKSNDEKANLKTEFSLRDLIYKMSAERGAKTVIEGNYLEYDYINLDENIKKAIEVMQNTKKDRYTFYTLNNENYIFYVKPLLDDGTCSQCHIHDDKKPGDLLGNVNLKMKIPSFREFNPGAYYFHMFMYTLTWLVGLGVIWFIRHKNRVFYDKSVQSYEESIYALVDMMERRDSYTAGHSKRVANYASMLADACGCSEDDVGKIYRAGMLHDLGKIEIPDALLLKPEKLDSVEYELIKTHAKFSYELLSREPFSELSTIVLHHHERYDGCGYPYGLKREEIPYLSQIISVADAFDAMTTNRAYREGYSVAKAIEVLKEESGKQFNPSIVKIAVETFKDVTLPENTTQMPRNALEEMRFSYYFKDQLTDSYNNDYLKFLLAHKKQDETICVYHINCKDFTSYNKKYGWKHGNIFLKAIADTLKLHYKNSVVIRVFGDNFLLVTLGKHIEINFSLLNPYTDGKNLSMEYKHIDLKEDKISTVEELEDKILEKA